MSYDPSIQARCMEIGKAPNYQRANRILKRHLRDPAVTKQGCAMLVKFFKVQWELKGR